LGQQKWGSKILTVAGLGLAASLVWFNPDQQAFEAYATGQLSHYLEANLCRDLASPLEQLMGLSCGDLLTANQGVLHQVIRDRTQRYNLALFSVYRTTLALPSFGMLPTYHIDTLGIWGQFYIVKVTQRL
jgi:hypothetical protein